MSKQIKALPRKSVLEEIAPAQGNFEFQVEKQAEIGGIGMGVLSDGTPFLHQRGLARLCGVENAHIGTISAQWNDTDQKPRISAIKDLLAARAITVDSPHIILPYRGQTMFAYSDKVCLAILEYYAFEAGPNSKTEALKNFRLLAGNALQDFIYAQVGYDPTNAVPQQWKQFHDRVALTYDSVPPGYFCIFKEIADMIVTLGQRGIHISDKFVPDISVGQGWSQFWAEQELDVAYGGRQKFKHNYPAYFAQAASNPQDTWCYPEAALGEFRKWFRESYIGEGKFATYLNSKAKKQELPRSFAQLAITAYYGEQ
jgi:hypothetical protein